MNDTPNVAHSLDIPETACTPVARFQTPPTDFTVSAEDSAKAQRHIRALAQAMTQRAARAGFAPPDCELIYWLHDADAVNNSDAIKRWVRTMLTNAPDLDFEDKVLFVEQRLQEILDEASW